MRATGLIFLALFALGILFFAFRGTIPGKKRAEIEVGMSVNEVSSLLQSGIADPYSCAWTAVDDQLTTSTQNCSLPSENFLSRSNSGYKVMVIFKGIGMDYDFFVSFDENRVVDSVSDGVIR
jgi:hypothetical protein